MEQTNTDLLETAPQIWAHLKQEGGIDLKRYDQALEDDLRTTLKLPGGDFERLISGVTTESLLFAFFRALEPYAMMMSDLMTVFESVGAKHSDRNMQIRFDFDEDGPPLAFDIEHFKDWTDAIVEVLRSRETRKWSTDLLWGLSSTFGYLDDEIEDPEVTRWLDEYNQNLWPRFFPSLPASGNLELDELLEQVWRLLQTVADRSRQFGSSRAALVEAAAAQTGNVDDDDGEATDWTAEILRSLDQDGWTGFVVRNVACTSQRWRNGIVQDSLCQSLKQIFESAPHTQTDVRSLIDQLLAILSLPFWKFRHELYSVWVFSRIRDAVNHARLRVHVAEESLTFSSRGSHLATLDASVPPVHLWAELRSPLKSPLGKYRIEGIQPDYSLVRDPITERSSSVIEIECKQYLRPSARNFSDALTDYATGRPNAHVILVNYGPVNQSTIDRVDPKVRPRTTQIGKFRPDNRDALAEFRSLIREKLGDHVTLPRATNHDTFPVNLSPNGTFTLQWGVNPRDLDLHMLLHTNGSDRFHISYEAMGKDTTFPFASLDHDIKEGQGPECITISDWQTGRYYVAVHNYSDDSPLAECQAIVTLELIDDRYIFTCPSEGSGRWWIVMVIDTKLQQLYEINQIVDYPWPERTVFSEDFSSNANGWYESASYVRIENGKYRFAHYKTSDKSWVV